MSDQAASSDAKEPQENRSPKFPYEIVLKALGNLGLIYAVLTFAGWVYLVGFLGVFSLDVWTLDLNILNLPLMVYVPIGDIVAWTRWFVIAGPIVLLVVQYEPIRKRLKNFVRKERENFARNKLTMFFRPLTWFAVYIFFIVVPLIWFEIGRTYGKTWLQRAIAGEDTKVQLTFKPGANNKPIENDLTRASDEGRLFILTQTKDIVVVFEPPKSAAHRPSVFVIARSELLVVRLV